MATRRVHLPLPQAGAMAHDEDFARDAANRGLLPDTGGLPSPSGNAQFEQRRLATQQHENSSSQLQLSGMLGSDSFAGFLCGRPECGLASPISAVVVVRAVVWRGFYNNNNMYPVTCANLQTTTTTQHNGGPHH